MMPWLLAALVLIAAYPWSRWLLQRSPSGDSRWLAVLVMLGLGMGALTLLMFWQGLLGMRFEPVAILVPYFLLMLPGVWLWRRARRGDEDHLKLDRSRQRTEVLLAVGLGMLCLAVLFNAAYWPFSRDDALGIYAPAAQSMYMGRALVPLPGAATLYEAYPVHISLTYTFAYLVSGWENEYLARLFPALLSLACLPAVFVLGRMLGGRPVGWVSAALLAITPTYGRWASSGYVDLPMAFYFLMAAIFVQRLGRSHHWADALLAGIMMGLAAWTKNAALFGIVLLAIWLAWLWFKEKMSLRLALLSLLACAVVALPWYARNLFQAGLIIPDTAWVEQADRSLASLLVFPRVYGLPGVLMMAGAVFTLWRVLRRTARVDPGYESGGLLLLWTVQFFIIWWWFASYDPRFLLLFAPVLCVMAALMLAWVYRQFPARWQTLLKLLALAATLALIAQAAWNSVEYKDEILRDPLMSTAQKIELVRGKS